MRTTTVELYRWTRQEFEQLASMGFFDPEERLELVEVADSSLHHDKNRKRPRYAQAGIAEYWILNLTEYCLEVHRDPAGGDYQSYLRLSTNDAVSPLSHAQLSLAAGDLLPQLRVM